MPSGVRQGLLCLLAIDPLSARTLIGGWLGFDITEAPTLRPQNCRRAAWRNFQC